MIKYYEEVDQGSDEWLALRCGILTASEMKLIVTPTLKIAANEATRTHLYELLAQRITRFVEPRYVSDAMLRGNEEEIEAKIAYSEYYAPVTDMGFIVNDKLGFDIGYSPDGLVGENGLIEVKSRCQKYQLETIISGEVPKEYMIQIQTGLLVSEREWCDFISYCGGLPMFVKRVYPQPEYQEAIIEASTKFMQDMFEKHEAYIGASKGLVKTERKIIEEMI